MMGFIFLVLSKISLFLFKPMATDFSFDLSIGNSFFTYLAINYPAVSIGFAQSLVFFQAYWINKTANSLRWFGEITYLPFWWFVILHSFFISHQYLSENQILNLAFLFVIRQLLKRPNQDSAMASAPLNIGAVFGILLIFSPKAWMMFFILFSMILFVGRLDAKKLLQILITAISYFLPLAYFMKWQGIPFQWKPTFSILKGYKFFTGTQDIVFYILILALLLISFLYRFPLKVHIYKLLDKIHLFLRTILLLSFLGIIFLFNYPTENFILLGIPMSFLLARISWITQYKSLFIIFFLALFLAFLYPFFYQFIG